MIALHEVVEVLLTSVRYDQYGSIAKPAGTDGIETLTAARLSRCCSGHWLISTHDTVGRRFVHV